MSKESLTPDPESQFEPDIARSARNYWAYFISLSLIGYYWPEILYVASRGVIDLRQSNVRQAACGAIVVTGMVLPAIVKETLSHYSTKV